MSKGVAKQRRRREANTQREPSAAAWRAGAVTPSFRVVLFSGEALWITVGLVTITALAYAPVWKNQFVDIDDAQYLPDNPVVSAGLTWRGLRWAFTTGYGSNWFPLTWLSHMTDVSLYGMNPGPHHLTSLLFHILNTVLLFGLLYRMTEALWQSAFVAALFAVHPLHVESVAWAAERKDVLSAFFGILTMWAYVKYAERPAVQRYALMMILLALGLMAKPMLVTLPFALLLMDYWPLGRFSFGSPQGGRTLWRLIREKIPLVALTVASSIIIFAVQAAGGSVNGLEKISLALRIQNALVSYLAYIGNLLWPARLAVFYPYPVSIPAWSLAGSVLVLLGITIAVLLLARRYAYLPVGWFWYLGTLVPVIGIVQVGGQARADRYTYIPLIGIFIMAAWGASDLLARWRCPRFVFAPVAGLIILACAVATQAQVRYWRDPVSLWSHALNVTTGNFPAHNNLALALAGQGKLDEAVANYREALRIKPDYARGYLNLGAALASQGKVDEAITAEREAARLDPSFADAHYNLGVALEWEGKIQEAIPEYLEGLRIEPDHSEWHYKAGVLLAQTGRRDEAEQHLEAALRLNPADAAAQRALEDLRRQASGGER